MNSLSIRRVGIGAFVFVVFIVTLGIVASAEPIVSIYDSTAREDGGTMAFGVTLSESSASTVTVNYMLSYNTADQDDVVYKTGTVTFAPGSVFEQIIITLRNDTEVEYSDERFFIYLSDPTNAWLGQEAASGTILDDDYQRTLSISDAYAEEDVGNMVFTVSLSWVTPGTVTIDYWTSYSWADQDDLTARSGTLTFPSGTSTQTISIPIKDDSDVEVTEHFYIYLGAATSARVNDDTGAGEIIDNDMPRTLSIASASADEGAGGMIFTVTLSDERAITVSANYQTSNGSASANSDYTSTSGTVTFPARTTSKTFSIPILDDSEVESDESFNVVLSGGVNAIILTPIGVGTIIDNEVPEIDVQRPAGTSFDDGDIDDLGSLLVGPVSLTYIIDNVAGTNELIVSSASAPSMTNASGLSVSGSFPLTIPAGASDSIGVAFDIDAAGAFNVGLQIANDDGDESPYHIAIQGVGLSPEIDVRGGTPPQSVASGDTTPDMADATDFGNVPLQTGSVDHTFTIINSGSAMLHFTGTSPVAIAGSHASDFTIDTQPAADLASGGGSVDVTLRFEPQALGLRSATLTIASDDLDEASYEFTVQGTGVSPEINLLGGTPAQSIDNGDATPATTDGTDFGKLLLATGPLMHTFTLMNEGSAELHLTGSPRISIAGDHASDFKIETQPSDTLSIAGGSSDFVLSFEPLDVGVRWAALLIDNDDLDEDPYQIVVQGTGISPEIDVLGGSSSLLIDNGDNDPRTEDGTHFGRVQANAGIATHTFCIKNSGSADLHLDGIPIVQIDTLVPGEFNVISQPTQTTLASGAASEFTIQFTPLGLGNRTAVVTIRSDDLDEDPYTFTIEGTGVLPPEDVCVIGLGADGGILTRNLGLPDDVEPPYLGTLPLAAEYVVGETIDGAFVLACEGESPSTTASIFVFCYHVTLNGVKEGLELVQNEIITFDRETQTYCFSLPTELMPPGCYNIFLEFEDRSIAVYRVGLAPAPISD